MDTSKKAILNIETDPGFRHLLSMVMVDVLGMKVDEVTSPEEGLRRIKQNPPYSILWCGEKFEKSRVNGISFLRICRDESPLSSRILCASSLKKTELNLMVKVGDIHSFCAKNDITSAYSISRPLKIGVEYHRVNLCGEFFDIADLTRQGQLDNNLRALGNALKEFETSEKLQLSGGDLVEEKLLDHAQFMLAKSNAWMSRQNDLLREMKDSQANQRYSKQFDYIHNIIAGLEAHLSKSRMHLNKSIEIAEERDIKIADMKIKIKKLKDQFRR